MKDRTTETNALLAEIAAQLRVLTDAHEARFSAVADELRRAEARDQWAASQLREARRALRDQRGLLCKIATALDDGVGGFD